MLWGREERSSKKQIKRGNDDVKMTREANKPCDKAEEKGCIEDGVVLSTCIDQICREVCGEATQVRSSVWLVPRLDLVDPWQASSPSGFGRFRLGTDRRSVDAGGAPYQDLDGPDRSPVTTIATWTGEKPTVESADEDGAAAVVRAVAGHNPNREGRV
ncbi:hypothetical protein NL676_003006 [Syzygium grande]|nr:hypothetical protein NL676_003006 [Syzygium grande]